MPSRSSKVVLVAAFMTAIGLAATAIGDVQNTEQIENLGLLALTTGVMPLLFGAVAGYFGRAAIDDYHSRRVADGKREIEAHREQIQGEAFVHAVELWRAGYLGGATSSSDSLTDTGGRRYDL